MKENNETLDSTEVKSAKLNFTCAGEALSARGTTIISAKNMCAEEQDKETFLMMKSLNALLHKDSDDDG